MPPASRGLRRSRGQVSCGRSRPAISSLRLALPLLLVAVAASSSSEQPEPRQPAVPGADAYDGDDVFLQEVSRICFRSDLRSQVEKCREFWSLHKAGCYRSRANWTKGCPHICPVNFRICGEAGLWRCTTERDCGLLELRGYVEHKHGVTTCKRICTIVGCDHCKTDGRCLACNSGFELLPDGQCRWQWLGLGYSIFIAFLLLIAYIVVTAVQMQLQGDGASSNRKALEAGRLARYRAKVIQFFKQSGPRYPLTVNMHFHKKGQVPICGPGMTLFMNWFVLLAAVAVWLSALAMAFGTTPGGCQAAAATLLQDDVENYPVWTGLSYLGSTLISFVFFVWQRKLWAMMTHDNEGEVPLHSYTLQAIGFPPHATDKAALLEFFWTGMRLQHLPPDMLEYISIAYAYAAEDAAWVNEAIDRHLEEEEVMYELRHKGEESGDSGDEDQPRSAASREAGSGLQRGRSELLRSRFGVVPDAGPLWLQLAAHVCFGTEIDWPHLEVKPVTPSPRRSDSSLAESLGRLRNSGSVFIVLRTQAMAIAMQSYVRMPNTYEGHQIRLKFVDSAPQVIYWEKFFLTKKAKFLRGIAAAFFIVATVVFWFICYAPTAWVYRMSVNAEGSSFLTNVQSLMAVSIIVGNAMLGIVVGRLTDWIGFKRQGTLLHARLLLLVPLMLLNVLCDMYWIVWKPSNEAFAEDSFKSHKALVLEVHQLVLGLLPSYCVVPYIGEPLFTVFGLLWIAIWRVKRDPRITPQQAERLLVAEGTDIVNPPYCDFICTTTIIVSTFLISPSEAHKRIFPWLLVATGVLYAQCRVRILRWESRSFYGTRRLDDVEAAFWALPLGLLAAAWERNLFKASSLVNPEISLRGWRFFTMHVMMHQLFLRYVVPTMEPQMPTGIQTYAQAQKRLRGHAGLADFLNANPIEVLKSHHSPELCTGRRLIYYRLDKEHLQERAVKEFKGETEYSLLVNNNVFEKFGRISVASPTSLLFAPDSAESSGSESSVGASTRTFVE